MGPAECVYIFKRLNIRKYRENISVVKHKMKAIKTGYAVRVESRMTTEGGNSFSTGDA